MHCKTVGAFYSEGARLRGRTLRGGVLGTFWKPPSQNPYWEPFSEPFFYRKTHIRPPSQNPSENPFSRTLPRTFSEPFLERCVAAQPVRRAPKLIAYSWSSFAYSGKVHLRSSSMDCKLARFESQPQNPFESLWCLYYPKYPVILKTIRSY